MPIAAAVACVFVASAQTLQPDTVVTPQKKVPAGAAPKAQPVLPTGNPKAQPVPAANQPVAPQSPAPQGPTLQGAQPANQPANPQSTLEVPKDNAAPAENPLLTADPDMVTLSAFSEPVDLSALVTLVATTLNINVTIIDTLDGKVAFNAAVPVRKSELLKLLDALLEQHGWTITRDESIGWYTVRKMDSVGVNFAGEIITTKVFSTPNLRPSAVQQAISGQIGGASGTPGAPAPGFQGAAGGGGKIQPIDELGIIVATDTPRRLKIIDELIQKILTEWGKAQFIRLELNNIAAPAARDRVLQLLGQASQARGTGDPNQPQQFNPAVRAQGIAGGSGGALDNIGDRLTVDPQSNALVFRGQQAEIDQVKSILAVIDVTKSLKPKRYYAGSSATQIADLARQSGLGEVTTISSQSGNGTDFNTGGFQPNQFNNRNQFANQNNQGGLVGGPVMVVDEANGTIIYYGTESQQEQLARLIEELDTNSEKIVIREYRLKNSDAQDVADVVLGLLNNQSTIGSSPLLADNSGGFGSTDLSGVRSGSRRRSGNNSSGTNSRNNRGSNSFANQGFYNNQNPNRQLGSGLGGEGVELDASNAFVIADIKNNQLLVKAPAGVQRDFAKLIEKLDLRRPQVYLECKIIAVSWSDDLRVAFETQLINANGTGGLLQTNFGLTTIGDDILQARTVRPNLQGFTSAIIKSEYVPIVMTALQTKADTRILSSPALLVDDNESAEIATVEQQPYSTTQVTTGSPNTTSFGGYAEAGTTLSIKPHIAEDGYLRLFYDAELSTFTGNGTNGLPPPKQTNNIGSDSITLPSDTTVIVGGINIDTKRTTRIQVPLLGDIPLIGHLFQDYNDTDRITTLYIFITPRILRDTNFADLRLLTEGPQAKSKLAPDVPDLEPTAIDISAEVLQPRPLPPPQPAAPPPAAPAPQQPKADAPAKPEPAPADPTKTEPATPAPVPTEPAKDEGAPKRP